MIVYLDSSVILAIIFEETNLKKTKEVWLSSEIRVSSILLEAECKTSIKRTFHQNQKKLGKNWKDRKLTELTKLLEEIHLKNIDQATMEILSKEDILFGCRTLDALHLATALEFRNEFGSELAIFSYDLEFIKVSKRLKFVTL